MNNHHEIISLHSVFPVKYEWEFFPQESFSWVMGGQNLLGKLVGWGLFYMGGLMIRSMPSKEWGRSVYPPPLSVNF